MHNILQGVSEPGQRVSDDEKAEIVDWIVDNAHRYWMSKGGPLRPPEEGGAHVIVVSIVDQGNCKKPTAHKCIRSTTPKCRVSFL